VLAPKRPPVWYPQPGGQQLAFRVPWSVREVLLTGPRGSGKSDTGLVAWLRGVGKGLGPDWRGFAFKRTSAEIEPLVAKASKLFKAECPKVHFRAAPYPQFIWPDGETLIFRHMFDTHDYDSVHGSEVSFLLWEELTNWPDPFVYLKCMSILRSSNPQAAQWSQVWSTTNPGQVGHNWVRDRWRLPEMTNKFVYDDIESLKKWTDDAAVLVSPRPRIAVFLDVRHNRKLLDVDPTYLSTIASTATSEAQRKAWLFGDWEIISGGMFDDLYSAQYHCVEPFDLPSSWRIDRSFDWGSSTPFAVLWFAESDGSDYQDRQGRWHSTVRGDLFVVHEWYGSNGQPNTGLKLTAAEVAQGITQRELEWGIYGRVRPGPADNQITNQVQTGQSIEIDMAKPVRIVSADGRVREYPGVTWERSDKANGARVTGWEMIRRRLQQAIPDVKNGLPREKPGLFFFDRCKDMLKHFKTTPRDEKNPDDVPTKGEYHLADTLRYRILHNGRDARSGSTVGYY
jgi:hypothetical protein